MKTYIKTLFPFESKWMDIDGNRIHYIDEGKGDVILFCHPPIATAFIYRNFIRKLAKSYRCIALDFPGFGASEASDDYTQTIESQALIVKKLIDKLKVDCVYPLIQEVGGHAALTALVSTPEKIKGIILTDTIIFPVSEYPMISRMLGIVNGALFRFINTRFNFLVSATYRYGIQKRKLSREERKHYADLFNTRRKRSLVTHMLHQLKVEEGLMQNIKKAFETTLVAKPILLIYGVKDLLFELGIPERIEKMVTNSELHLIDGEAHFPHEGAPDEMISIIDNWIKPTNIVNPRLTDARAD